jgi:hypothetical protein
MAILGQPRFELLHTGLQYRVVCQHQLQLLLLLRDQLFQFGDAGFCCHALMLHYTASRAEWLHEFFNDFYVTPFVTLARQAHGIAIEKAPFAVS